MSPFVLKFDGSGKKWAYILKKDNIIVAYDRGTIDGVCSMFCEWTALHNGLLKSVKLAVQNIYVTGDCKSIIDILIGCGEHRKRADLFKLSQQCLGLLATMKWKASHISRIDNDEVDRLVHNGRLGHWQAHPV
jgi:hypothetical protein